MLRFSGRKVHMQVRNLTEGSTDYTSNVWHICGSYHALADRNTLVDVGRDQMILPPLRSVRCGLGKKPVEQIILTHSHFDHAGLLSTLKELYSPVVLAHPKSRIAEKKILTDREHILIGDRDCTIVFTPGHSEDSLCVLCEEEQILFSGDSPIRVYGIDGEYFSSFVDAFELFVSADIRVIYPGHGDPITHNVPHLLRESLRNIRKSRIV